MARSSFLVALLIAILALANGFSPIVNKSARQSMALPVKIKIDVGDGEPIESALRRFKREVNKSGHMMELRHKRYFENTQERKKRKIREAGMRRKFERMARRRNNNNA